MPKKLKGYTIFEIILVIGIMLVIASFVMPMSLRETKKNELNSYGRELESNIFYQQQLAYAGKASGNHGVHFQNNGYWLFEGETYETALHKDFFQFPRNISLNYNISDILFTRSSLKPHSINSITLNNGLDSFVISINNEGMIDYET